MTIHSFPDLEDSLPVPEKERRELFLRRGHGGWFVEDKNGWSLAFCFTRWGARREAREILRKQSEFRERVTL